MVALLALSIAVADKIQNSQGTLCASPAQSETSALGCHGEKVDVVTETQTRFNPVAPLRHWIEQTTEHQVKNNQGLEKKNTKPTVVRREEKRHMANMRVARKVKRQLTGRWEAKKTGDQQNATASYKVRSTASGIRVTLDTMRRGGLTEGEGKRRFGCPFSPSSPPFPMVMDASLQDVVSCILSFERRCKRFLVEERAN
jgi:hypothetical protein